MAAASRAIGFGANWKLRSLLYGLTLRAFASEQPPLHRFAENRAVKY